MTEAWKTTAISADEDMPLGEGYDFPEMRHRRAEYVGMVRRQLEWGPARWARERALPWAVGVLERRRSDARWSPVSRSSSRTRRARRVRTALTVPTPAQLQPGQPSDAGTLLSRLAQTTPIMLAL